jgi:hypothetical protein
MGHGAVRRAVERLLIDGRLEKDFSDQRDDSADHHGRVRRGPMRASPPARVSPRLSLLELRHPLSSSPGGNWRILYLEFPKLISNSAHQLQARSLCPVIEFAGIQKCRVGHVYSFASV